ncbi:LysR family transcriptional regulator [Pelomicrobium sp.]|jgi:DNA-binding transcriptional LysR family regulator|uniref:LysR family transcriptional regulator n=1 Tax=Pelomicrobium sp. TaxID=2815319 RepID=UPI002FDD5DBC
MADRRLQVFYTVAKQLSFTKAAELLFMTQPAVTFQVKQLEEHFNTRLFERSHGKISLTPAGQLVFDYAERILSLSSEMETRMQEMTGGLAGPLSIGASTTIAEFMIPRILGEFKSAYPRVQPRLVVGNSEMIENLVADHMLDLGFIESPPHLPQLKNEILCEDELVMICAPQHPLAQSTSVTPKQLAELPYVSREPGSGTREFADQFFAKHGLTPEEMNIVMELGSPEAVKGVVETGLGFGVLSRATVEKELKLRTLVAVPFRPRLTRIMSMVLPKEKFRSRLLTTFVDFAAARFNNPAKAKA